jgi:cytochrome c-type biogenesis protein CcmE
VRNKRIIIFIIAVILLVIAILSISDDIFSPYVTIKYAKENPAKYVQLIGKRPKDSKVSHTPSGFSFTLTDEHAEELEIFHRGVKPQNFEHAQQIVILGKYSLEKKLFEADKVLTKCPSKYQKEAEGNKTK